MEMLEIIIKVSNISSVCVIILKSLTIIILRQDRYICVIEEGEANHRYSYDTALLNKRM